MTALHRLKAYFGMVPAEEFDEFDAAAFDAAGFDNYHPGYGYPDSRHDLSGHHQPGYEHHPRHNPSERSAMHRPHRTSLDSYDESFAAPAGQHMASRVHPRSPSCATDSRVSASRAPEPWSADAPVHGSLAIDTAAADEARLDGRPTARQPVATQSGTPRTGPLTSDEAFPLARIVTLHPHSYNEARPIGERYREGNPVIMNLTAMEDRDAKRLVDFAAGLAFALRGSIDKVTNKVFLLSPPDLDVSAEDRRRIAEGRYYA